MLAPEVEELPVTGLSFPLWILVTCSEVLELGVSASIKW